MRNNGTPKPPPNYLLMGSVTGEMWNRLQAMPKEIQKAKFQPNPSAQLPILLSNQGVIMQALALLLDEAVGRRGHPRPLKFQVVKANENHTPIIQAVK